MLWIPASQIPVCNLFCRFVVTWLRWRRLLLEHLVNNCPDPAKSRPTENTAEIVVPYPLEMKQQWKLIKWSNGDILTKVRLNYAVQRMIDLEKSFSRLHQSPNRYSLLWHCCKCWTLFFTFTSKDKHRPNISVEFTLVLGLTFCHPRS